MKEIERVLWRCRRGLLEMDIVLGRFIEKHYADLSDEQKVAFDAMLDLPDNIFWDMVTGRQAPPQDTQQQVILEYLKVV
jgi:antitoxin CptB